MNNSTINLLGILTGNTVSIDGKSIQNQELKPQSSDGVFRQLLALQTQIKGSDATKIDVNGLPLGGKVMPEAVVADLESLDIDQLAELAQKIVSLSANVGEMNQGEILPVATKLLPANQLLPELSKSKEFQPNKIAVPAQSLDEIAKQNGIAPEVLTQVISMTVDKSVKTTDVTSSAITTSVGNDDVKALQAEQLVSRSDAQPGTNTVNHLVGDSADADIPVQLVNPSTSSNVQVDNAIKLADPLAQSDVVKAVSEMPAKEGMVKSDIRSSTIASPTASEGVTKLVLKDEDVIALAKAATSAQIEHAKSTLSEGQSVTKQRSELITMLQQMSGRIKSIKEEGVASSAVKKPQQAVTADNFLSNRATYAADSADVNVLKSVKDNAALLQMSAHKSVNLTSSFIQQKAFQAKPVSEEIIPTALSDKASSPLTLSTTSLDSQSAPTQDVQRTAPTAKEFLMNAQNDERIQKAIGDRVMRMVETGKWDTEMELNPTRLGTIRIRMSMDNNEMQLALTSQNSSVRDLLEVNMPRLRAGLNDSGISLGNTSVNQDSPSQAGSGFNQGQFASNQAVNGNVVKTATDDQIVSDEQKQSNHDGELDTFA